MVTLLVAIIVNGVMHTEKVGDFPSFEECAVVQVTIPNSVCMEER